MGGEGRGEEGRERVGEEERNGGRGSEEMGGGREIGVESRSEKEAKELEGGGETFGDK